MYRLLLLLILIFAFSCGEDEPEQECQSCYLKVTSDEPLLCETDDQEAVLSNKMLGVYCDASEIQELIEEHSKTEAGHGNCAGWFVTIKTRVVCR